MNNTEYVNQFTKESKKLGDDLRRLLVDYGIGTQRNASTKQRVTAIRAKRKLVNESKVLKRVLTDLSREWVNDVIPKAANSGFKQAQNELKNIAKELDDGKTQGELAEALLMLDEEWVNMMI